MLRSLSSYEKQFYENIGTFLLTAAPNISLPLPFTHTCVETQVSVKEEKA